MGMSGLTALVTGATAGIGRAVAAQLAREGAQVIIHGRDAERGAAVVREIERDGGTARFVQADLTVTAEVLRLAEEAGEVDILINNAGVYRFLPTSQMTEDLFDLHMNLNTKAPYLLVRAAGAPHGGAGPRGHRQHQHTGRRRHHHGHGHVRRFQGGP